MHSRRKPVQRHSGLKYRLPKISETNCRDETTDFPIPDSQRVSMPNPGQYLLPASIQDVMDVAPAYVADGSG
jgi:hypothetical protein